MLLNLMKYIFYLWPFIVFVGNDAFIWSVRFFLKVMYVNFSVLFSSGIFHLFTPVHLSQIIGGNNKVYLSLPVTQLRFVGHKPRVRVVSSIDTAHCHVCITPLLGHLPSSRFDASNTMMLFWINVVRKTLWIKVRYPNEHNWHALSICSPETWQLQKC